MHYVPSIAVDQSLESVEAPKFTKHTHICFFSLSYGNSCFSKLSRDDQRSFARHLRGKPITDLMSTGLLRIEASTHKNDEVHEVTETVLCLKQGPPALCEKECMVCVCQLFIVCAEWYMICACSTLGFTPFDIYTPMHYVLI